MNIVFGKSIENVRDRVDVRLVTDSKTKQRFANKSNFKNFKQINGDLYTIKLSKTHSKYEKPIYVSCSVLDVSKTTMYEFLYDVMKPLYGDKMVLNYMDTDSFIFEIETDDIYKDVETNAELKDKFDFSDYPKGHPLFNENYKKELGKMKDEANGKIINEFAGCRLKMYAVDIENSNPIKKAKGIKENVVAGLDIENYKNSIMNKIKILKIQYLIQSKNHELFTFEQKKIALSSDNDKRIILEDKISTVPYGWKF